MPIEGNKRQRAVIDFRGGEGADIEPRHYAYACVGEALDALQALPACALGRQLINLLAEHQKHEPCADRSLQLAARAEAISRKVDDELSERHRIAISHAVEIIDSCRRAIEFEAGDNRDSAWRALIVAFEMSSALSNTANISRDQRRAANARYEGKIQDDARYSTYELWCEKRGGTNPALPTDSAFVAEICKEHPDWNYLTVAKWVQRWKKQTAEIFDPWPLFSTGRYSDR